MSPLFVGFQTTQLSQKPPKNSLLATLFSMICLLQMHCAFLSYNLIPLLPTQTNDQVEATRGWASANGHMTSAPHLGRLGLRVCQLFTSPPFLPPTLTVCQSLSESLAHHFLLLCFSSFSLVSSLSIIAGTPRCLNPGPLLPLLFSAILQSSRHYKVHLLYLIFIFLGKPLTVRKLTLFLERVMFN